MIFTRVILIRPIILLQKPVVLHELGHSLGLFHEHSRPDRNSAISIRWSNIKPAVRNNFETRDTKTYGVPYDYRSIMHYGPFVS